MANDIWVLAASPDPEVKMVKGVIAVCPLRRIGRGGIFVVAVL